MIANEALILVVAKNAKYSGKNGVERLFLASYMPRREKIYFHDRARGRRGCGKGPHKR